MAIAAADESNTAITLHGVMQTMIAEGLRSHYQPAQKLSHELFVLLLQLKEQEPKPAAPKMPRKARP
jgi:hypothetical protein